MRWLADENIPRALVTALRALGHDVLEAGECSPGAADPALLALARDQDRIQISFDRDHGDLIFGQGVPPPRRSEEHTSELQSLMRISYAVFCLKKKKNHHTKTQQ